jgi:SAM-dependent methyltransferase
MIMRVHWDEVRYFHDPGSVTRRSYLTRFLTDYGNGTPAGVLDFGCGKGRHAFLAAARWPSAHTVGVDADERVLAVGRSRAASRGFNRVAFFREDEWNEESDSFDVVICVDVLEHVADDAGTLKRLARATREGGLLILHVPAVGQSRYWGIAQEDTRHAGGEEFGHVRDGYGRDGLNALLEGAGFRPQEWRNTIGKAAAWLTDLDFILARWKLHPVRLLTYVASLVAARREVRKRLAAGRGIMVVARRVADH